MTANKMIGNHAKPKIQLPWYLCPIGRANPIRIVAQTRRMTLIVLWKMWRPLVIDDCSSISNGSWTLMGICGKYTCIYFWQHNPVDYATGLVVGAVFGGPNENWTRDSWCRLRCGCLYHHRPTKPRWKKCRTNKNSPSIIVKIRSSRGERLRHQDLMMIHHHTEWIYWTIFSGYRQWKIPWYLSTNHSQNVHKKTKNMGIKIYVWTTALPPPVFKTVSSDVYE